KKLNEWKEKNLSRAEKVVLIKSEGEILEQGSPWLMGDGSSVKIWNDKWLPQHNGFCIWSAMKVLDE
ncbi:unnamed protein product, partial [Dovyalis caffra]